ncbi:MAG TPA: long-chain fatty acid--CoA ligase [Parafilimonas sp.]|nr:long-chain fatty acid--CoA ligase [Parafilimonas sp.]
MLNLSVILEDNARRYPHRPAFTLGDTTFTYNQVNSYANRIASALKTLGIMPGEKVAMCLPNIPQFPMVYFGILKAGAVVVPLSVLFKKEEFIYHLNDSDAKLFICFSGTPEIPMGRYGNAAFKECANCRHIFIVSKGNNIPGTEDALAFEEMITGQPDTFESEQTGADDTAVIVYTSGTTGSGKGAELTHSNLFTNAVLSTNIFRLSNEDVQLVVLPLFHIFGMTVMMNAGIYKGVHNILLPKFDAGMAFKLIAKHSISILAAVPTMYWGLVNYNAEDFDEAVIAKCLRLCVSGGASLPVEILKTFEKRFDVPILEGYGMSEGSPVVTFNHLDIGRKTGSIGTPVWGVEVKLADENGEEVPVGEKGELLYRGPNVMKGYYKRPGDTAAVLKNGWMHSGDVAIKDEDGFFYIVDRIKDIIIRGGMNIYPREVEEILMQHPVISMVTIIGTPHEKLGEEIKAFIVLKKDQAAPAEEIIMWAKERMASYKYPRLIEFMDALPMSASGKILKRVLKANNG